jgi:hypothetical protein
MLDHNFCLSMSDCLSASSTTSQLALSLMTVSSSTSIEQQNGRTQHTPAYFVRLRSEETMSQAPGSGGLSNRFNSYQQSFGHNAAGRIFAEEQTNTLKDTVTTQYQAEETANAVLTQLHGQRQQLQSANDDVWETRQLTEETKRELHALSAKYREKKNRLRVVIGLLGLFDVLLFLRLLRCGGSFFCRR